MDVSSAVFLSIRLILGAIFGVAGISKLLDQQGTRRVFTEFHVPRFAVGPAALLLPILEIMTAAALLISFSVVWGAFGVVVLSTMFVVVVGLSFARGRRPDCFCFGEFFSGPIGWPTLVRNLALLFLGCVVLSQETGGSIWDQLAIRTERSPAEFALTILSLFLAVMLGITYLRYKALSNRFNLVLFPDQTPGLSIGDESPAVSLPNLAGENIELASFFNGEKPMLLVFLNFVCAACDEVVPDIEKWQRQFASGVVILAIMSGTTEEAAKKLGRIDPALVLIEQGRDTQRAFRTPSIPSSVLIRPDGTIGSKLALGSAEIRRLMANVMDDLHRTRSMSVSRVQVAEG